VKLKSSFAIGGWALATTAVLRRWLGTLDYKVDFSDPDVDPVSPAYRGAKIYVFWHENILIPLYLRGHSNISMLLSRHWDANILDRVARMMGFGVVRGSTFHGGSAALRELAERAAVGNLTITPDGPRGPRRRLAPGCVFLASTLGIPIVVMGLGYDRPKRVGTWDRFAIPRPFSRARGIVSRAISVPPGLDRDGIERYSFERVFARSAHRCETQTRVRRDGSRIRPRPRTRTARADTSVHDLAIGLHRRASRGDSRAEPCHGRRNRCKPRPRVAGGRVGRPRTLDVESDERLPRSH
jgi:lysophospholipid acyltransferase (LPLAT)-like uncharacterized protein